MGSDRERGIRAAKTSVNRVRKGLKNTNSTSRKNDLFGFVKNQERESKETIRELEQDKRLSVTDKTRRKLIREEKGALSVFKRFNTSRR